MNADLLIIGAGPAGIAAASEAARSGASFNLIDETGRAGGAIGLAYETRGIPFVADRTPGGGHDEVERTPGIGGTHTGIGGWCGVEGVVHAAQA